MFCFPKSRINENGGNQNLLLVYYTYHQVLLTHIIPLLEIEIPGFYYDPVKKRYFKITEDHPAKKFVLCHCGGWKEATSDNHNRVIPSNIKVTKVSIRHPVVIKVQKYKNKN